MGDPQEDNATKIDDIFNCVEVGDKANRFQKLYLNKKLCSDQPLESAIAEAEKQLKKLEQDYVHTQKKYIEARAARWGFYDEKHHAILRSDFAGYLVRDCKWLIEQLQGGLDKLNSKTIPKETKSIDHMRLSVGKSLRFSMLHGTKTLAQEKVLLQQNTKPQNQEDREIRSVTIDFRLINYELRYLQRSCLKYKCTKPVHNLLRELKSTRKSKERAIANGALEGDLTSQEHLIKSMENEVKLLKMLMGEFEEDRSKSQHESLNAKQLLENAEKKERHLEEKSEDLRKRCEEEKKHFLKLKKKTRHEVNINSLEESFE